MPNLKISFARGIPPRVSASHECADSMKPTIYGGINGATTYCGAGRGSNYATWNRRV